MNVHRRTQDYLDWKMERDRMEVSFQGYARCMAMPLADLRALWDSYDLDSMCVSDPAICVEAVHMALNMRGDGNYCRI